MTKSLVRTRVASKDWWASRIVVSVSNSPLCALTAFAKPSGPEVSRTCLNPILAFSSTGGGNTGGVTLAVDLNGLSTATVAVASDSIAIIDADDSNASKKETITDLVSGIASGDINKPHSANVALPDDIVPVTERTVAKKKDVSEMLDLDDLDL